MNYTDTLSKMQLDLNVNINRDTINAEDKHKWLFDYLLALHVEAVELLDCINWKWWTKEGKENQYHKLVDEKNAKVEAIDCLHFLMSICHITNLIKEKDNDDIFYKSMIGIKEASNDDTEEQKERLLSTFISYIIIGTGALLSKINVNYVANNKLSYVNDFVDNYQEYELTEQDYNAIISLINSLVSIFHILGMDIDDVYRIYKMKHEKNILRQENGYSSLTKTEDDNNEIKENI